MATTTIVIYRTALGQLRVFLGGVVLPPGEELRFEMKSDDVVLDVEDAAEINEAPPGQPVNYVTDIEAHPDEPQEPEQPQPNT